MRPSYPSVRTPFPFNKVSKSSSSSHKLFRTREACSDLPTGLASPNETARRADGSLILSLTRVLSANSAWYALAYRPTPAYDGNASCAHTIDSDPYHSRTGGLNDVERKARSEAQARGESGTGTRGCRFVVAGGWCLGRDKRSAGGGPASSNDHAESRDHPRRGRAFRRQPVDLLCLRQRERQVSAW